MIRARLGDWALALVVPLLLLVGYDLWARGAGDFFFPPLSVIGGNFADDWLFERVPTDLLPSLARMLAGYAIAVAIGVVAGMVLGSLRTLAIALDPVLQFLRALPPPTLIPVSLLVFGAGDSAKIFLIALGALWPVLLNTVDGVRGVDPTVLDMARSYRIPARARLLRVVLPAALPRIFAGARTALAIAIILMVVSELVGASNGVGHTVQLAQRGFNIPEMWAGTVLLGLVGFAFNALFVAVERRALGWHHGSTGRGGAPTRRTRLRRERPRPVLTPTRTAVAVESAAAGPAPTEGSVPDARRQ
ncbi:ABC transporter permease [Blastococcus sp. TBT05-19]|uniref:ABC transporter permease n=1 Tax=Blastococcus sp. TBT05-19 TaxID=2250581 RepID=UPI000DE8A381|nr:ABC transporter permease [Blastococcus sp. TBT05-19]RBY94747.1 ABC transporter permease [Blastococcus sp. TBT05-19]